MTITNWLDWFLMKTEHKAGNLKQTNKRHKGNSKRDKIRAAGPGKVNKVEKSVHKNE